MNQPTSRHQLVVGAADMLRRRGLNATSVRDVAKHSGAPLGSTYHYFPDGKSQLAAEAVRFADTLAAQKLTKELVAGPAAGLREFLEMWRKIVLNSDFQAGCPVLAVAVEDHSTPVANPESDPRLAAAAAFENWTRLLANSLREHGADEDDAVQTAELIVAAVEGAVAMCRVQRSLGPLDRAGAALEAVIARVLAAAPAS